MGPRGAILLATTPLGPYAARYVDLFFEVTTKVELYPETLEVLSVGDVKGAKAAGLRLCGSTAMIDRAALRGLGRVDER